MSESIDHSEALAKAFVAACKVTFSPAEYKAIRTRNAAYRAQGRLDICATHDICDANEIMHDCWVDIMGRDLEHDSDTDARLWGKAWSRAHDLGLSA